MSAAVKTMRVKVLLAFHDWRKIYHNIPIIAALTTGAQSHTKNEKAMILKITSRLLIYTGKNQNKYEINIIQSVMLNQLTAMKCVSHELLKSSFNSAGIFSLAQNNIPHKNIDSRAGNILPILDNKFSRTTNILYIKLSIS
jgi:hypothetical protein